MICNYKIFVFVNTKQKEKTRIVTFLNMKGVNGKNV